MASVLSLRCAVSELHGATTLPDGSIGISRTELGDIAMTVISYDDGGMSVYVGDVDHRESKLIEFPEPLGSELDALIRRSLKPPAMVPVAAEPAVPS